mgnify:CR=1 FL=1
MRRCGHLRLRSGGTAGRRARAGCHPRPDARPRSRRSGALDRPETSHGARSPPPFHTCWTLDRGRIRHPHRRSFLPTLGERGIVVLARKNSNHGLRDDGFGRGRRSLSGLAHSRAPFLRLAARSSAAEARSIAVPRPLRIIHIHRWPGKQGHSIERLFDTIGRALEDKSVCRSWRLSSKWGRPADIRGLRALDADIYHVTGDCHHIAWFLPAGRTIVTVHDLGRFLHGMRGLRRWIFGKLWFEGPLSRVAAITTISAKTEAELLSSFPRLAVRRVEVVPNCVPDGLSFSPKPFGAGRPTVLQVGTAPHKNLRRVARALVGIPCRLVVIGALGDSDREFLAQLPVEVELRGAVDDAGIVAAYVEADLVVFASEYEGFGLPILEAQAVGRPLVTSDRAPMREIAGEGALLVDPTNEDAIRAAVSRIFSDPGLRARLVAAGQANVARYSARNVAARYLELYSRVASTAGRGGRSGADGVANAAISACASLLE